MPVPCGETVSVEFVTLDETTERISCVLVDDAKLQPSPAGNTGELIEENCPVIEPAFKIANVFPSEGVNPFTSRTSSAPPKFAETARFNRENCESGVSPPIETLNPPPRFCVNVAVPVIVVVPGEAKSPGSIVPVDVTGDEIEPMPVSVPLVPTLTPFDELSVPST